MKKRTILTALALTVALSACAPRPTVESASPETATPTPVETLSPTPLPTFTPTPEPTPEPTPTRDPSIRPTDEEVLAAYDEVREAQSWFYLTTLPLDRDSEPIGEEWYFPVADERFPTMDALPTYLQTLFSNQIADILLG